MPTCNSSSRGPGICRHCTHKVHRCTCRQNTQMHKIEEEQHSNWRTGSVIGNLARKRVLMRIKVMHILTLGAGMHLTLVAECLSIIYAAFHTQRHRLNTVLTNFSTIQTFFKQMHQLSTLLNVKLNFTFLNHEHLYLRIYFSSVRRLHGTRGLYNTLKQV